MPRPGPRPGTRRLAHESEAALGELGEGQVRVVTEVMLDDGIIPRIVLNSHR